MKFCSIPEAMKEIKNGKMLIIVDSPFRENEGDFFFPAKLATAKKVNFLIKQGGGLVCVAISKNQALNLHLPLMVNGLFNTEKTKVNFGLSVNASKCISTGISAYDRSKTIKILAEPKAKPSDLARPGHIFPLIAETEGLAKRQGHTEAAVALCKLAGFFPAGVLCEIIRDDGKMAKLPDLLKIAQKFNLKIVLIKELLKWLEKNPLEKEGPLKSIIRVAESLLPTNYGTFKIIIYKTIMDNREHSVLLMESKKNAPTLVRIHSQCLTGDTFLSLKCDCREQLHQSMKIISKNKRGVIIYLNQEGRGIGLANKIMTYGLQEKGLDTVEANNAIGFSADERDYQTAAEILKDLNISKITLLTNNPQKTNDLISYGINVQKIIPLRIKPNRINRDYLLTKKIKLGHNLSNV
ncbi:GTP cyclohydrolase II [Patescibacteria group bacterium]|nr:GTP cyclohydrolase II [Patescibacteria group bacterium]